MLFLIDFFRGHTLIIILVVATVVSLFWILKCSEIIKIKWPAAIVLSVVHTFWGVAAVKGFAFLETLGTARGAMSIYGAVFAMPILYFLGAKIFKRKLSDVFDVFTFATIFTLFCSRINCLMSGCCLGIELSNGMRVPTRELEMVFYFVMLNILFVKVPTGKMYGRAYPLYMLSYGVFRFIIEFFREGKAIIFGIFHISHVWSVLSFIIGFCFFVALTKRHTEPKKLKS